MTASDVLGGLAALIVGGGLMMILTGEWRRPDK